MGNTIDKNQPHILHEEIERYSRKLSRDPRSTAFAQLAELYLKINMVDEAIRVCENGLIYYPEYVTARMILSRAYLSKGDNGKAEVELGKIITISPDNIFARKTLAQIYENENKLDEALEQYRLAMKFEHSDNSIKEAIELLQKRIDERKELNLRKDNVIEKEDTQDISNDEILGTMTLADLLVKQGLYDDAIKIYKKRLLKNPSDSNARLKLLEVLSLSKK